MDPVLQQAAQMVRSVERSLQPSAVGGRPQKWGDSQVMPLGSPIFGASIVDNPEQNFIDVGPFPEPVTFGLSWDCTPDIDTTKVTAAVPTWRFRYTLGVGDGIVDKGTTARTSLNGLPYLPRQVRGTSLQVYAARGPCSVGDQNPKFALWATLEPSPHTPQPVPFQHDWITMGVGVTTFTLTTWPLSATHLVVGTEVSSYRVNIRQRPAATNAVTPTYNRFATQAFTGSVIMTPFLVPMVTLTDGAPIIERDASASGGNFLLLWCK